MGLMDKMYEDSKYAAKKRQKNNEAAARKAEAKKRREEAEAARKKKLAEIEAKKKKKSKEWTYKDKVNYSILAIVMVPLFQLFFIYHQGSWLDIVLQSTKNSKYLKQFLPDGDGLPYSKGEQGAGIKCKDIKKYLPARESSGGEAPSAPNNPPQAGGKRKRRVQKGGFSSGLNDTKEFFDSTKYGIPYEWADNDNVLMSGIGNYFITFWQNQRAALKFLLENTNEAFFKDHKEPNGLGEQVWDFTKFSIILPVVNIIAHLGQYVTSLGLLFWASFNNQTILIVPFFTLAICCIFLGWLTGYFWPWGFFSMYLTAFNLRPNQQRLNNFQTYGKRYKWLWCFSILFWWFMIIGGYIWKWHKDAMTFLGIVAALFFLGMVGVSTLV